MSSDASGAPRLVRTLVPRAAPVAGRSLAATARDHIGALAPLWVHDATPVGLAAAGEQRLRSGATVIRLAQQVDGVPIDGGELRVLHGDGALAAVAGTLQPATAARAFALPPRVAVERALHQQYPAARPPPAIAVTGERDGWYQLEVGSDPQLQIATARTRRVRAATGGALAPAWETELVGRDVRRGVRHTPGGRMAYRYLITEDGATLRSTDLVDSDAFVYRAYAETAGNRRPLDGAFESFAPHPTGVPDGSAPEFAATNLVEMEAFNAPRDAWLPGDATTTAGNNAEVFADLDGSRSFTEGDIRPEVQAGRVLDHVFDVTQRPLASPEQSKAAAVNAFYTVNWMHDWWYDAGFTEATGNAQQDNYGRGGVDGDRLSIFAQSGAAIGDSGNAFMFTPADGRAPEMQLLLWPDNIELVTTPTRTVKAVTLAHAPAEFELSGVLVAALDATTPAEDACEPITSDVTGKIALISFTGMCGPLTAITNARAAGAIGVIYVDTFDPPVPFKEASAALPSLEIGASDGAALAAALAQGPFSVGLRRVVGIERDSDLDNTVIAHEFGHYLHRRLSQCASEPCNGMSEGWGDFNALMMLLREGDPRGGTYAVSAYASTIAGADAAYFGLRRFPYSTDRTKNALTYRHIVDGEPLPTATPGMPHPFGNSEVHNTGEVWATMLWEVLNALADEHGVTSARRRMSDYVVAGLLLTPPEATFTEARDGILAAASALDPGDVVRIAAAFASRGAGSCAVSPAPNAVGNVGVVESYSLGANLQVGGLSVTEDGDACDHDGYLDPGESGTLRVTVANSSAFAAEGMTITASTSTPGLRFGDPVRLPGLASFASREITIPVTVLASAPLGVFATFELRATADNGCASDALATVTQRIGVDEALAASRIDRVQTRATPWTPTGEPEVWRIAIDGALDGSWVSDGATRTSDAQLVSPPLQVSSSEALVLSISHAYSMAAALDVLFEGAVIELSRDDGATWADVAQFGVDPGYNGMLFPGLNNPLEDRAAFGGQSPGFPARQTLRLDFGTQFAGQSVRVRFRFAGGFGGSSWILDDIAVEGVVNTPFPELVPEPSVCTSGAP
jgi:hypothetical protein